MNTKVIQTIADHYNPREKGRYSIVDWELQFSNPDAQQALKWAQTYCANQPIQFFATSEQHQSLFPPLFFVPVAEYGSVPTTAMDVGFQTVSTTQSAITKTFVWKNEGVEQYNEGEPFNATYIEGAANTIRTRKVGAKICETYESIKHTPLDRMQQNVRLTLQEFRRRDNRLFMHELHKATSNEFAHGFIDGKRRPIVNDDGDAIGARELFDNAYEADEYLSDDPWELIRGGRQKMLRRAQDAVRPRICVINATTESELADANEVKHANLLGGADTYFRTGSLPNIYGLTFVVVPDSEHGYFLDDVSRKNDQFVMTNDIFLLEPNGTILRHTLDPLQTEEWRIWDGQKQALNLWENYEYSTFRYTNIMRVIRDKPNSGVQILV